MDESTWLKEMWTHGPYAFMLLLLIFGMWRIGTSAAAWMQPRIDALISAFLKHIEGINAKMDGVHDDLQEVRTTIKTTATRIDDIHQRVVSRGRDELDPTNRH